MLHTMKVKGVQISPNMLHAPNIFYCAPYAESKSCRLGTT